MIKIVSIDKMNFKFKVNHTSRELVPLPIFRWSLGSYGVRWPAISHSTSPTGNRINIGDEASAFLLVADGTYFEF